MADTVQGARRRELSAQAHLVALAAAILLPLVLAAAALLWRDAGAGRDRYRQDALELARQLAEDVDRELDGMILALQVLATAPALQAGDLAGFDAQARAVLRYRGANVVLRDRTGQQLVNTRLPFGAPLPVSQDAQVREADAAVFATGQPYVSDLFTGTVSREPLLFADVPVPRDGAVAYALVMTITPARLSELLAAGLPSPEWLAAAVDREDRIIGRSRKMEQFVGDSASEDLRRHTAGAEGVWVGTTADGTPVLAAYARPQLAGWRVVVRVPEALVEAPLWRLLRLLLLGAALAFALAALLAAWWGRRLAGAIRTLATAGAALGRGEPVPVAASPVREVNLVGRALAAAAAALRERTRERDAVEAALRESEQRYRALVETSPEAIFVHLDGTVTFANRQAAALFGAARPDDLVGRSVLGELVDPACLPLARQRTAGITAPGERAEPAELTYRRLDGAPFPVEATAAGVLIDGRLAVQVVFRDTTERERAEERQRLLLEELNHRVKNTLAVVQGLARQTAGRTASVPEFVDAFSGRVRALAAAHGLLVATGWSGASLAALVRRTLEPHATAGQVAVGVADAIVPAGLAQGLALTLHELGTNAVKHGALSAVGGRVTVEGGVADGAAGRELRLTWRETGGPAAERPVRPGFGTVLLTRTLAHAHGGEVVLDWRREGLVCTIRVPLAPPEGARAA